MNATRLRLWLQTAAIRWIDPLFASRHPGPVLAAAIRGARPLLRHLQPNDRWNLDAFVAEWARLLRQPPALPLPPAKRIFMFSCYRGQFTPDLVLAMLLAWRGHKITFGYLPKLRSPIKEPLADNAGASRYISAILGQLDRLTGGRVRAVDLSRYAAGDDPQCDEDYLVSQTRADTILYLQRERLDLGDLAIKQVWDYYAALGRRTQNIAWRWFQAQAGAFDLVLLANGSSFEAGHVCRVAKSMGLPITTHEKFAFSRVKIVTHGDAFFHFSDLDRIWRRAGELGFGRAPLREQAIGRAWELLDQRRGSSGGAWGWQYQKGRPRRDAGELARQLGVTPGEFILLCPNVPFDSGYDGWLKLFPSMRDWLDRTVAFLLAHSDRKLVLRAHPAETRPGYGEEKLASILAEAGLRSDRLIVLPGDSDVNTYDLMPLCRCAVVFASTTGVEIAMHGKPVLAGASVYYARCGISLPAENEIAYFDQLGRLAGAETLPAADADAAAQLYFMFHYLLQWRYPYDKPSQIAALPPRLLADHPDLATWLETLDAMTMTAPEFEAALPRFTDPARIARIWQWPAPAAVAEAA